jgi:hypothetical protein
MNIPNDYDLDLQKIAILMKENNIDYLLKEDEIIVNSNSIEIRISCDIRRISLVIPTPKLIAPLLFFMVFIITGVLQRLLFKNLVTILKDWINTIPFLLAFITAFLLTEPIYLLNKPMVLTERNKIKEILLNYKE